MKTFKRFLYRHLPLRTYLRVLSFGFFTVRRLGLGRRKFEYLYVMRRLVRWDDVVLDLGANLGYYSRELSRLVGEDGQVHAVEPFPPVYEVLLHNIRRCQNVGVMSVALGEKDGTVTMINDCADGYMGTGRNRVSGDEAELRFEVEMRRGSEVFDGLDRLNFVKCDVEGCELAILTEMRPLLERFHPVCMVESVGENRQKVIELFGSLGYTGCVLERGHFVKVEDVEGEKDIIFLAINEMLTEITKRYEG